jgi:4-hydroxy-4-methyl-2-oxoglutarate aldolase
VHEAAGRVGLLDSWIRPIQDGMRIAGTAVTVLCGLDDNLAIHLAVERCAPGDIRVVALEHPSGAAMLGEMLATSLRAHGVIGAVVDAGVRDVAALRAMGFTVRSRWISAQGPDNNNAVSVNEPVVCAGQTVEPGDVVIADDDGVMCVSAAAAERIAELAAERAAREDQLRTRLADGELTIDLLGLREVAGHVDSKPPQG